MYGTWGALVGTCKVQRKSKYYNLSLYLEMITADFCICHLQVYNQYIESIPNILVAYC